jgi:hypothetical protein
MEGKIMIGKEEVTLEQLQEMIGDKCEGTVIYFGSCDTMNIDRRRLMSFMNKTKTQLIENKNLDLFLNNEVNKTISEKKYIANNYLLNNDTQEEINRLTQENSHLKYKLDILRENNQDTNPEVIALQKQIESLLLENDMMKKKIGEFDQNSIRLDDQIRFKIKDMIREKQVLLAEYAEKNNDDDLKRKINSIPDNIDDILDLLYILKTLDREQNRIGPESYSNKAILEELLKENSKLATKLSQYIIKPLVQSELVELRKQNEELNKKLMENQNNSNDIIIDQFNNLEKQIKNEG